MTSPSYIYTLSLHDALPIYRYLMTVVATAANPVFTVSRVDIDRPGATYTADTLRDLGAQHRSEEHTSELQSRGHLVCRLLLEKKNIPTRTLINNRAQTSIRP